MNTVSFDTLGYFEKLVNAGFSDTQARVQVDAMNDFIKKYDEVSRKELATKGDIHDIKVEIEQIRAELKIDMKNLELRLIRWQLGIGLAVIAIVAKGFGWIGF